MSVLAHKQTTKDLEILIDLYQSGKVVPKIDTIYSLNETQTAFEQLSQG